MNEVFGLLDSLEATILDGKKIPLTEKSVIEEKRLLVLVDKIRLALKSEGRIVHESIHHAKEESSENVAHPVSEKGGSVAGTQESVDDILEKAKKEAKHIKFGANQYADNILAGLQLLVTKMHKNLLNMEKTIDNGRGVLDKTREDTQERE